MGPFRADQVGSLLRPHGLAEARKKGDVQFQRRAIEEAVRQQEKIGLDWKSNTAGEFAAFLREEVQKWAKAVKDSGAKAD